MQAFINPPYRLKAPGNAETVEEFSIDVPGKLFDLYLLEDSAKKYNPPKLMNVLGMWVFAGGYWVLRIAHEVDPDRTPGTWKYKFTSGNEIAYCDFNLIGYTYGEEMLNDAIAEIKRQGFGWRAVSNPERSWCKQRFIAHFTWAIEKVWWEYKFEPIEVQDCSGVNGAALDGHPPMVHSGGGVLDFSYPKTDKGDINYQALFDLIYDAVKLNPRIHFSVHSTIAEGLGFIVPPPHITIDDNPVHKHDKHCHAWEQ